ncbi:hypothetical protein [uncultured Nostoc sp.]|uniref:hypothetical protein n=1 Tax=uncultured Nostoc sp. TaxID=340711 RepID=UPI0035CA85F7
MSEAKDLEKSANLTKDKQSSNSINYSYNYKINPIVALSIVSMLTSVFGLSAFSSAFGNIVGGACYIAMLIPFGVACTIEGKRRYDLTKQIDTTDDPKIKQELEDELAKSKSKYAHDMTNKTISGICGVLITAGISLFLPHTIPVLIACSLVSTALAEVAIQQIHPYKEPELNNKNLIKGKTQKKSLEPELQQALSPIKSQEVPVIENPLFEEGKGKDILAKQQEKELVNAGNSR